MNQPIKQNNYHLWLPVLLIALIAFGVHANTIFNDYAWDDPMVFSKNPEILEPALDVFSRVDNTRSLEKFPYYRPLSILTFVLEQRIHQLNPACMHLLNVLLHTSCSVLVYLFVQCLTTNRLTPIVTALLFAIHPISTESVAFLSGGRNTLLATTFGLSAYILHYKAIQKENTFRFIIPSALLLFAALLSKELAIGIVPFICYQEIQGFAHGTFTIRKHAVRRLALYCIPITAYFLMRTFALSSAGIQLEILPGFFTRIFNNIYTIPRYLLTILWPPYSSIYYTIPSSLKIYAFYLISAWCCISISIWWFLTRGKSHVTLLGMAWCFVFWLPTSGIIPFPSAPMADRYLYLAIIGFWLIVADQFSKIFNAKAEYNKPLVVGGVLLLTLLSFSSNIKNRDWKNDVTLFSSYIKHNPNQAFGHHNLGTAYLEIQHNLASAEEEFLKALQLDPQSPHTHTQLGYIFQLKDDLKIAFSHYSAALVTNPYDAEAMLNRGIILDMMQRPEEALVSYKSFLETPDRGLDKVRNKAEARIRELEQILATKH